MEKKVVIVVGMHRSGTSLLSLFLSELGINMGDEKLSSSHANPTGHHEDMFFLNLHTKILNNCGGDWDSPPNKKLLQKEWMKHFTTIQDKLEQKSIENSVWGWKDPRTSLFLESYLKTIKNPLIIYCTRSSKEVEDSIYARDKISKEHSKLLKKHYDFEIKRTLKKYPNTPVLEVKFKEMIEYPRDTINSLIDFLGIQDQEINADYLINKIIDRKEIQKIKIKYKKTESLILIKKSIKQPLTAFTVILHRIKRKSWRRNWYSKSA